MYLMTKNQQRFIHRSASAIRVSDHIGVSSKRGDGGQEVYNSVHALDGGERGHLGVLYSFLYLYTTPGTLLVYVLSSPKRS